MKAAVLTGHGDRDVLQVRTDWPTPTIQRPHEVLLKVQACGMNNTDINTRLGWYSKSVTTATDGTQVQAKSSSNSSNTENEGSWRQGRENSGVAFPRIQGADVCGVVVAVGDAVPKHLMGKRVLADTWLRDWDNQDDETVVPGFLGSEADGGFAEYCVIDYRNLGVIEKRTDLSDAELATFSCSYSTAEGMLSRANVKAGDRVLIAGASGGVGSALIQLANRRGAITIAMASRSKHEQVAELNPSFLLDRAPDDLGAALKQVTGSDKVDVVADIVAGPYFPKLIEQIRRGGQYVTSGAIAGPIVQLDVRTLYLQDLTLHGSTVVPPHVFQDLVGYIERGEIRPILAATYPLEDIHAAQEAFVAKRHTGNIVLIP